MDDTPSLVEWAGGPEAFRRLIDAFYDRVERDDLLAPLFPAGSARSTAPTSPPGGSRSSAAPRRTPRSSAATAGCSTTTAVSASPPEQRFRFATLMSRAADDAGLPDDPEFRAAFVGYVEWGTRLALANSQPGAEVGRGGTRPALGLGRRPAVPTLTRC